MPYREFKLIHSQTCARIEGWSPWQQIEGAKGQTWRITDGNLAT